MKKIVKVYCLEYREPLMAVPISCLLFGFTLTILEKDWDFLYLSGLVLVTFFLATGWNLYKKKEFYESMLRDLSPHEEFVVCGQGTLAHIERERLGKIRSFFTTRIAELKQENRNYKLLINKWVHQMKTPLSVLNLLTQAEGPIPRCELKEEICRMDRLLNQVLQLLRVDAIERDFMVEHCSLLDLVKGVINDQRTYFIQHEVYPRVSIDSNLYVYTDQKWFSFALGQLVNNAVKYSEAGSHVVIEAKESAGEVTLQIKDHGIGIAPEDLPRIFDFCYTGRNGRGRQGESTGLGLYLVKNIFSYLNHRMDVASQKEQGTIFKLYLCGDDKKR